MATHASGAIHQTPYCGPSTDNLSWWLGKGKMAFQNRSFLNSINRHSAFVITWLLYLALCIKIYFSSHKETLQSRQSYHSSLKLKEWWIAGNDSFKIIHISTVELGWDLGPTDKRSCEVLILSVLYKCSVGFQSSDIILSL